MLRQKREEELRTQEMQRDAAVLTMEFVKPSGGMVKVLADGRKVSQQTQLGIRKESAEMEVTYKSDVSCELVTGTGDDERRFCCQISDLVLDTEQEKQWKQLGSDPSGLRLQVKFVRRSHGPKAGFAIADIRATVPITPTVNAAPAKTATA